MKFTKANLPLDSRSLVHFLRTKCEAESHRLIKGSAMSVYDTDVIIEKVKKMIQKHKRDARYNKWLPLWESHIKILKGLNNG